MKTLYHLATDANDLPKDAVFVDGNGFKYIIPYDEPTEFQSDFMAGKVVEHCHYFGIVEVRATKTRSGIDYDLVDAKERALKSLEISEKACINDYITTQLEDRVRSNFPPLPPTGRSLECVVKHKYNLLKAGIRCIGWEPPYHMDDPGFGNTPAVAPNNMMEMMMQLQTQLMNQQNMINELFLAKGSSAKTTNKGPALKRAEPEPDTATVGTDSSVQL